ncbi:sigma-54-dependent Fis family transcriptional regulator [Cytobacillus sp. Hz8]|uniref:sigma-54-dependent Fis family transcriptional regulator n=1 Tax=Cytobacillus sp. Hz8 TaxID=3347168 RepID=UPI0035DEEBCC
MLNPFLSIFSTQNLQEKTKELGTLWERFITRSKQDTLPEEMRKNVFDSWKRCQDKGVNPIQVQVKSAVPDSDFNKLLEDSELYQVGKLIIDDFFQKLLGTRYLFTLADKSGRIIYIKGDPKIKREAEKMNFFLGMDWSEDSAGTNAIGTSIITKNPIQIFSAEHFCQVCHSWTCSAAPIIHPFTQEVIGSIDFTSLWENAQPHTLGLAITVAQLIEKQLSQIYVRVNHHLSDYFDQTSIKWKSNEILVLNHAFIVVKSSKTLIEKLKLSPSANLKNLKDFQDLLVTLKRTSGSHQTNFSDAQMQIRNFQILSIESIWFEGRFVGYMIVFSKDNSTLNPMPRNLSLKDGPWKEVIGNSDALLKTIHKCQKASSSNVPILLLGESGTGKEKLALSIHKSSLRTNKPFLAINCGTLQKELIGSELFGYEKGTFTGGAKDGKKGKFEEANEGSLFLDEIGEMPLDLQVHLLRVLQEKEITRMGSSRTIPVNVRIIAATNKNLFDLCKKGLFREDLLFRLNVVTIHIPPLRERKKDIPLIIDYFLQQFSQKYDQTPLSITQETLDYFMEYTWPGNIRELQNALEYAVIFSDSPIIDLENLPTYLLDNQMIAPPRRQTNIPSQTDIDERQTLTQLLIENNYNITAVAKKLNIARSTLYRKLKKFQLNGLQKTVPIVKGTGEE